MIRKIYMPVLQEITVLYVESDPDIRKSTEHIIRENEMRVLSTDTSLNAYDIFRTNKVDIIVIDCKSPHGTGFRSPPSTAKTFYPGYPHYHRNEREAFI
ncbi:MAG: response regulator [Epsilonproteobacteria bacterium]|nr:response regulator [Campylobacterota bacterium]